eukprot:5308752-Amphidinium_carterae.1
MASSIDCDAQDIDMKNVCFIPSAHSPPSTGTLWIVAQIAVWTLLLVRLQFECFKEYCEYYWRQEYVATRIFRLGVVSTAASAYIDVISDVGALRLFMREEWWVAVGLSVAILLLSPLLTYLFLHVLGRPSGRAWWKDLLIYALQLHIVAAAADAWQTQRSSSQLFWTIIVETLCESVLQSLLQVYSFAAAPEVFAAARAPYHLDMTGKDWFSFSILYSLINMGKTMALLIDTYGNGRIFLRPGDEVVLEGDSVSQQRTVARVLEHGVQVQPLGEGDVEDNYRHTSQIKARAYSDSPWKMPEFGIGRKILRLLHRV